MKRLISLLLVLVMMVTIAPEFPELFELKAEAAATGTTSGGYEYEVSDEGVVTF